MKISEELRRICQSSSTGAYLGVFFASSHIEYHFPSVAFGGEGVRHGGVGPGRPEEKGRGVVDSERRPQRVRQVAR